MPVTRDEVILGYKLFLGREPESELVIQNHMQCDNIDALRKRFLSSAEFSAKVPIASRGAAFFAQAPRLEVDTVASGHEVSQIIDKVRETWTHLGVTKPHWSVLTNEKYLPQNLDGTIDQFWASGERNAAQLEGILARHDSRPLSTMSCIDYGCGVGRVTIPLARKFAHVYGYDISSAHLSLARKHAEEGGFDNITYHLCSETFLDQLNDCDVFYSLIVFQHNPPPIISILIANALRSLKPGGIAVFQVPIYRKNYRFKTSEWLNTEHDLKMQMHCLPQQHIFSIVGKERSDVLEVWEVVNGDQKNPFISNIFVIRKSTD